MVLFFFSLLTSSGRTLPDNHAHVSRKSERVRCAHRSDGGMEGGVERLSNETVWVTRVRAAALAVADAHQHFCRLLLPRNQAVKGVEKSALCLGIIRGEYGPFVDVYI